MKTKIKQFIPKVGVVFELNGKTKLYRCTIVGLKGILSRGRPIVGFPQTDKAGPAPSGVGLFGEYVITEVYALDDTEKSRGITYTKVTAVKLDSNDQFDPKGIQLKFQTAHLGDQDPVGTVVKVVGKMKQQVTFVEMQAEDGVDVLREDIKHAFIDFERAAKHWGCMEEYGSGKNVNSAEHDFKSTRSKLIEAILSGSEEL